MNSPYVPDAGDIVWLRFTPQAGHERAGHRPALVLSPARYNRIGLMLCCPMTTRIKGYPFEVIVAGSPKVLADQVKSLDGGPVRPEKKGRVAGAVLDEVRAKATALIGG